MPAAVAWRSASLCPFRSRLGAVLLDDVLRGHDTPAFLRACTAASGQEDGGADPSGGGLPLCFLFLLQMQRPASARFGSRSASFCRKWVRGCGSDCATSGGAGRGGERSRERGERSCGRVPRSSGEESARTREENDRARGFRAAPGRRALARGRRAFAWARRAFVQPGSTPGRRGEPSRGEESVRAREESDRAAGFRAAPARRAFARARRAFVRGRRAIVLAGSAPRRRGERSRAGGERSRNGRRSCRRAPRRAADDSDRAGGFFVAPARRARLRGLTRLPVGLLSSVSPSDYGPASGGRT